MKEPYNTGNFNSHIGKCQGTPKSQKLPAGGMKTIESFFAKAGPATSDSSPGQAISNVPKPSNNLILPCLGLREASYTQIRDYLERTGANGGGSPSVSFLATELFGKKYRHLSKSRKQQVKMARVMNGFGIITTRKEQFIQPNVQRKPRFSILPHPSPHTQTLFCYCVKIVINSSN